MPKLISHALVLPDKDFQQWYAAAQQYVQTFERVAVVRSPAGFNLNRFRNVTAVQTPGLWLNDNALEHIRRVYPMVVRVDVVTARTPAELKTILDRRARANDRFGETENADKHIHDRFTLDMPVNIPGTRITRTFNQDIGGNKSEGVHFSAPVGTPVKAAIGGVVAVVSRQPTALNYGESDRRKRAGRDQAGGADARQGTARLCAAGRDRSDAAAVLGGLPCACDG
jgi:murein DD-endopeptidase MepM/ murein hydrolase activator NlpD